ncbi:hypothetical protein FOCC_FOCC012020 [Frankliniella occidentalis]|nr:hypothetical protein FOCC_FOCC012020 [Frankliniella occidentalis]
METAYSSGSRSQSLARLRARKQSLNIAPVDRTIHCLDVPKVRLSSGGDIPIVGLGTRQSLTKLQLDYVDLYLIHMPFAVKREAHDNDLLELTEVNKIATKHNKTSAQILLRHTVQRGIIVIPKSFKPDRIRQNIDILDFTLDDSEMAELDALDKGLDGKRFVMKHIEGLWKHPEYPWTALLNSTEERPKSSN